MTKIMYFIVFLLIFSFIYFGIHYVVYVNIAKYFSLSKKFLFVLLILFIISGCSLILGNLLSHYFDFYFLLHYGYIWMGILLPSFFFILIGSGFSLILPSKSKLFMLFALMLTFITVLYSIYNASRDPVVKNYSIVHQDIIRDMNGFSIVQLSDLHINNLTSYKWIKKIVKTTNSLTPDIVLITGDLIDEKIKQENQIIKILKKIKSKYGVYAVTGNHEYYSGLNNFINLTEKSNITVLRNEKFYLKNTIELIGIDDDSFKTLSKQNENRFSILDKIKPENFTILIYHRPTNFKNSIKKGVDFQISAHTHAGQILPFNIIVMLAYRYPYGLYKKNKSYIYTSCGTGIWGPPMRFLSRSEIVKFNLKSQISD